MGLFKRKKEVKKEEVPSLPELPKLPEFPNQQKGKIKPVDELPEYPSSSSEEKFSRNTMKNAISGKEEGDKEAWDADEFARNQEMQMMQQPLKKPMTKSYKQMEEEKQEIPEQFTKAASRVKKTEPLFIRIDKFEESLKIFEQTKEKISEINKILKDIKKVKEEEEKELDSWEKEIQIIKKQIDKIDQNVFSKIE